MKKWLLGIVLAGLWAVSLFYTYGLGGLAGIHMPELVREPAKAAMPLAALWYSGRACNEGDRTACGFQDTAGRKPVNCADYASGDNSAVLFAFGQSNSANAGRSPYTAEGKVANFNPHDGKCYRAKDPLLGPNGSGGSVWGQVGDQLIAGGHYNRVLVVPFGIGGTNIARWIPGGDLHVRVEHTAKAMHEAGIKATHVLWHQGESDVDKTSGDAYTQMFAALVAALRDYGIDAPVYPAVATICMNKGSDELRAAQAALPGNIPGVKPGPNTDSLNKPYHRFDACHFSAQGMRSHAKLWVKAITASG